ncbi:MAG: hypothetical protein RL380_1546, partial [Verrucomicrobiota bacterium]
MLNLIKKFVVTGALVALALTVFVSPLKAQTVPTGSVLILYDSAGEYGWVGGIHARHLANLLGHFDQPFVIAPVESYTAGTMDGAKATFYFGTVYDNPLPAAFQADTLTTTNTLCWFRYNMWQVAGTNFTGKFGFQFNWLDWSGYSNIVYKGESLVKNQLDPELGYVTVTDTNLATVPAIAVMTDTNGAVTASIPYVTHAGNLWYVADLPFEYMSEEDRYLAFADLLHDILKIDHAESHRALIRIEDVAPTFYTPAVLQQTARLFQSNSVPFAIALVPHYNDPLGTYNSGVADSHHLADPTDTNSTAFASAIRYCMARGAQLVIHGYSHQYNSVANPYDGCTGDDFEFWRETFNTATTNDPFDLDIYAPIAEDSVDYVLNRINTAKGELASAGFSAVGWESPHYASSELDYRVFATNFPLVMHRVLYFDDLGHISGQMFPYIINKDIYGQRIVPENLGNIEPEVWQNYPARSAEVIVRAAKKNLVVRDGFASAYFHPFYDLTNLTAMITGIKALGYTYVQVSGSEPPSLTTQPASRTNNAGTTASFTSAAVGAAPLTYQWRFNDAPLAGATNASLSLGSVQTNQAGNYTVVVSNPFGSVISYAAKLTVNFLPPAIITQPVSRTNNAGTTATFAVTVSGSAPLAFAWYLNDVRLTYSSGTAVSSTLTLTNVQQASTGNYYAIITNAAGVVTSSVVALTVVDTAPVITSQPASRTNNAGTTASFSVAVTGTTPRTFQWSFNGTNLLNATNSSFSVGNVQQANVGNYSVTVSNALGSVTSGNARLTVVDIAPVITSQPASRTNNANSTASFSVSVTGTTPRTFQWRFNGTNIVNATNSSLSVANVLPANAGNYSVVIANALGSVTSSNALLTVIVLAPTITSQPASRTNAVGTTATFTVSLSGSTPRTFQWRRNGVNIAGGTNQTLTLSNVQLAQAGNYSLVV